MGKPTLVVQLVGGKPSFGTTVGVCVILKQDLDSYCPRLIMLRQQVSRNRVVSSQFAPLSDSFQPWGQAETRSLETT